jgi:hypothetical protein
LQRDGEAGVKKNELKPWKKEMWCIPGEPSAEFVCAMEDVLDVYKRSYNADFPVVCMDEKSKQLTKEVRAALPAEPGKAGDLDEPVKPGKPERVDGEYTRNGVANIFILAEPLTGQFQAKVTECRTKVDWANLIKELVDVHYPKAREITLVLDNLNTHAKSSLYEAFAPEEAKRIADRLDIHPTPKHGSWLNIAEIALNILSGQCLRRRIPDMTTLKREVAAWEKSHNHNSKPVDWQFTTEKARVKLKRLYPTFQNG